MKKILFLLIISGALTTWSQNGTYLVILNSEENSNGEETLLFDSIWVRLSTSSKKLNRIGKKLGATQIDLENVGLNQLKLESLKYNIEDNFIKTRMRFDTVRKGHSKFEQKFKDWNFRDSMYNDSLKKERVRKDKLEREEFLKKNGYPKPRYSGGVLNGAYAKRSVFFDSTFGYMPIKDTLVFEPFYLKNTPVTNSEYKEFVNWVQDSVVREIILKNITREHIENYNLDPNIIQKMIILKPGYEETDFDELERDCFKLNFKFEFRKDDRWVSHIISEEFYLPQPRRYYKMKRIDVSNLVFNYIKNDTLTISQNIYPDTLGFVRLKSKGSQNELLANMYFWHPAFDNCPIVNISYRQMKAFLHWKSMMLNAEYAQKGIKFELELPTMEEIELAMIQMKGSALYHQFSSPESFIKRCDTTSLLANKERYPILKNNINSNDIQFLGWNVSEYSQTPPGIITSKMNNIQWSPTAKIIYGTNWVDRTKIFQKGFCTNAMETTDVVGNENFSRAYLGFRYTIRISEQ